MIALIAKLCDRLIDWCIRRRGFDPAKREIYVFGADLLLSSIFTDVALLLLSLSIGRLPEAILYLVVTTPLRTYGGGWHAPTHLSCAAVQTASFLLVLTVSVFLPNEFRLGLSSIGVIVTLIAILCVVPSEHPENPLDPDRKKRMKTICLISHLVICAVTSGLFFFGQANFATLVAVSATTSGISFLIPNRKKGGDSNEEADDSEPA